MKSTKSRFKLSTMLSVLEDLGINLYTNSAPVLSEIAANAWDADAKKVLVSVKGAGASRQLTIQDDGRGMTADEVNKRFLYRTRVMQYDEVIASAKLRYHDFLIKQQDANRINAVLESIDASDMGGGKISVPGAKVKSLPVASQMNPIVRGPKRA